MKKTDNSIKKLDSRSHWDVYDNDENDVLPDQYLSLSRHVWFTLFDSFARLGPLQRCSSDFWAPEIVQNQDRKVMAEIVFFFTRLSKKVVSLPEDHVLAILASPNVDSLWNLASRTSLGALPARTLTPIADSMNSIYPCACDGRWDHVRAPLVELRQPCKSTYSTVQFSSWETS